MDVRGEKNLYRLGHNKTFLALSALGATAIIAACGGGGSSTPPPPGSSPTPAASPELVGSMKVVVPGGGGYATAAYGSAATVGVDFSCGCAKVAGSGTTDGSGNFTLVQSSTPVPTPNPPYTIVAGRNYLEVGSPTGGPQAWTMVFAGSIPSHDQYLNPGNQLASAPSDVYSAAVALYVFQFSNPGVVAYDDWNFNQLVIWYNTLKTGVGRTAHENTLLTDIYNESIAGHVLWPSVPGWRPTPFPTNPGSILADLNAVNTDGMALDNTLPTMCPGGQAGCTNTPTP